MDLHIRAYVNILAQICHMDYMLNFTEENTHTNTVTFYQ